MYRLYIDETGNADLKASARDPNHRYLSLTGIIINLDYAGTTVFPRIEELKADIFGSHPDDPIVLHRKDIVEKKYPFNALRDPDIEKKFNRSLLKLLSDLDYLVVTVVIDKLEHLQKYEVWRYDPYHYCLEVLVERYLNFLRTSNNKGDVMAEVRGGKADRRLEKSYAGLYEDGTSNISRTEVQRRLTSKKLKMRPKAANVAGLQLADLLASPSALYVRHFFAKSPRPDRFAGEVVNVLLDDKYRRGYAGKLNGYGIKWLP